MFQRDHIERLLRLNGLSPNSPEEEIKSVLISAQWHEDDVEAAVLVLRENTESHKTHVDSLHKIFRSDERLRPETISSLLGIEMDLSSKEVAARRAHFRKRVGVVHMMMITFIALILSLIFVFAAMWYLKMGLFYPAYPGL